MATMLVTLAPTVHTAGLPALLEGAGHQVAQVEDGLQAYLACLREPPDVLVCGQMLPRLEGCVLRALLRLHDLPRQPGILMLLRPGEEDPRALEAVVGSAVLHLPCEDGLVLEALAGLLQWSRAQAHGEPSAG